VIRFGTFIEGGSCDSDGNCDLRWQGKTLIKNRQARQMEPRGTFEMAKAKALIVTSDVNHELSFHLKLIVLDLKLNQ
jgi:hypothetical protein